MVSLGKIALPLVAAAILIVPTYSSTAGTLIDRHIQVAQSETGNSGVYINIAIENVEVDRTEASRGDKINFKITLHNMGEEGERRAVIRATSRRKVLVEKIVDLDYWDVKDKNVVMMTRDTSGNEAGRYRVKIEPPIFGDANDFDNVYRLKGEIVIR